MGTIVRALILLAVMASPYVARAHGPAQWIQEGNFRNPAGELCCGERDCAEVPDEFVKIGPWGYRVTLLVPMSSDGLVGIKIEEIPFAETQPSPDGHYWRCQWGGVRKCFFAPPGST